MRQSKSFYSANRVNVHQFGLVALLMAASATIHADTPNPFARPESPQQDQPFNSPSTPSDLELQGTLVGSGAPLATINGKLYFQGDHLGAYVVEEITADSVRLQRGDVSTQISLRRDDQRPIKPR